MKTLILLALTCLSWSVEGSKILLVFPATAPSHYILGNALARGLAERGHDVTMISPFEEKNPPENGTYRNVVLTTMLEELEAVEPDVNMFDFFDINPFIAISFMGAMSSKMTELSLAHPNVQKLIKSEEKFDAVIIEQFLNDGQKVLANHFDAPLILFSTISANNWINPLVGNPAPPSYIPELFFGYSSQMTFCERLVNTLFVVFTQLFYNFYMFPSHNKIAQQHVPGSPNLYDSLYNSSIVLLNSHPSINQAVPNVPSMIEIGGYHIKPAKKLPGDLQEFLDNSKEGVVYFSMGSNLKSSELPVEKRDAILRAFSKLKQKVLWKWEEDVLPGKPENVKLGKWLPQQDILAHPNVKVFITHGGLLSTTEATYYGVPILAIPIFADQNMNAQIAVANGVGLSITYRELNEETLGTKLKEVLENSKYMQNAKLRSKLFHDRESTPMDTALFWIEYVIRHRGAPHLRVAALDLPLYKYLLLDVIAFIVVISFVVLYLEFLLARRICRKFWPCTQTSLARNKDSQKKKQ